MAGDDQETYRTSYRMFSIIVLLPMLLTISITLGVWAELEAGPARPLALPLVFIFLYPQYRALRIILIRSHQTEQC